MANSEQVQIIKTGSAAWNKWRQKHPAASIDLTGVVLPGKYLAGANLREANLQGANLREVDLKRGDLTEADLRGVNLTGTDLTEARLIKADLTEANLTGARLTNANLARTDLSKAELRGALLMNALLTDSSLRGSVLFDTNFTNARVGNASFFEARLWRTILGDVDLSYARDLEAAKHLGPSVIGIDTLYRSNGKIPETFLRGAGVPETFIDRIHSMTKHPLQFYSCFISYSHADKAFAHRLHDGLQGRGIRCWLDNKDISVGEDIYEAVDHGIRVSDKLLLCCSRASLTSWWVDDEIGRAFAKEQKLLKDTGTRVHVLIPLDLDGYLRKEWTDPKATTVNRRLAADFKGWEHENDKFEEQFERVVRALRTDKGPR